MPSLKTDSDRRSIAEEHSPERERPLASYGVLMGTFSGLAAAFAAWFHRSGR